MDSTLNIVSFTVPTSSFLAAVAALGLVAGHRAAVRFISSYFLYAFFMF